MVAETALERSADVVKLPRPVLVRGGPLLQDDELVTSKLLAMIQEASAIKEPEPNINGHIFWRRVRLRSKLTALIKAANALEIALQVKEMNDGEDRRLATYRRRLGDPETDKT